MRELVPVTERPMMLIGVCVKKGPMGVVGVVGGVEGGGVCWEGPMGGTGFRGSGLSVSMAERILGIELSTFVVADLVGNIWCICGYIFHTLSRYSHFGAFAHLPRKEEAQGIMRCSHISLSSYAA